MTKSFSFTLAVRKSAVNGGSHIKRCPFCCRIDHFLTHFDRRKADEMAFAREGDHLARHTAGSQFFAQQRRVFIGDQVVLVAVNKQSVMSSPVNAVRSDGRQVSSSVFPLASSVRSAGVDMETIMPMGMGLSLQWV